VAYEVHPGKPTSNNLDHLGAMHHPLSSANVSSSSNELSFVQGDAILFGVSWSMGEVGLER